MNPVDELTRSSLRSTNAWQEAGAVLATLMRARCGEAARTGAQSGLWWGGDLAGVLPRGGCTSAMGWRLADADGRRLRRSTQVLAGQAPDPLHLLHATDLRHDAAHLQRELERSPLRDLEQYLVAHESLRHAAEHAPAVAGESVDVLLADFPFNRHACQADIADALRDAMRVLRRGGRLLCSALVADEGVEGRHALHGLDDTAALALPTEAAWLAAVEAAGFHGITLHNASAQPLDRVEGADIRLWLLEAYKGKQGPCWELGQAVIYRGPWREVRDDDGHAYPRGTRVAVCAKTFDLLNRAPYEGQFVGLHALNEPTLADAQAFDCNTPALRDPQVTKGLKPFVGQAKGGAGCAPGSGCC
jgi:SAM-dependent methyltransferase